MTPQDVKRFNEKYRKLQQDKYEVKKSGVVKYKKKRKK